MVAFRSPSFLLTEASLETLADAIADLSAHAPRVDADGLCRLQPGPVDSLPELARPSLVPLKKVFLPPREQLWSYRSGQFAAPEAPRAVAVVGVPLCDLQALWYLDQVFAEEPAYQNRRARSLVVGMHCEPTPDCRCQRELMPLAGDLFLDRQRAWALSPAGEVLLQKCAEREAVEKPLPWPTVETGQRPELTEEHFRSAADNEIWAHTAQTCLSCGACSVVCPTCYCFDMLDESSADGTVTRRRLWDNCFFAEHARVAGGHDFRSGRAARLRFRMEHKFFSFGTLKGQNACVGCGRCRKACPVDIDLDQIAAQLAGEELI